MNNEKVYILYEKLCNNTEPFTEEDDTKILLVTVNKEKALEMYEDKRTEKALELWDNIDWFNNTLDEEEDGNYHTESTSENMTQLVIVEDYTYYVLTLEERILE